MSKDKECNCGGKCKCGKPCACTNKFETEFKDLMHELSEKLGVVCIEYLYNEIDPDGPFEIAAHGYHQHGIDGQRPFHFTDPTIIGAVKKCLANIKRACPGDNCSRECPEYDNTNHAMS